MREADRGRSLMQGVSGYLHDDRRLLRDQGLSVFVVFDRIGPTKTLRRHRDLAIHSMADVESLSFSRGIEGIQDIEGIERLVLQEGVSPNEPSGHSRTPLSLAAACGYVGVATRLAGPGADIAP